MARRHPTSFRRLRALASYGVLTLVPVLLLGLVLAASFRSEATRRGVAEGRSEAVLVARTAVEPILDGRPLADGLSPTERQRLEQIVNHVAPERGVLRLRLRDLSGQVVFSDDGSGVKVAPDDDALDAAQGQTVARLTHLNADSSDAGPVGPASVEVYVPLRGGTPSKRVGVLEIYLPYAAHRRRRERRAARPLPGPRDRPRHRVRRAARPRAVSEPAAAPAGAPERVPRRPRPADRPRQPVPLPPPGPGAVASARRRGTSAVIALLDLDRFKEINDTLGHHNGDVVLVELAARLGGTPPRPTSSRGSVATSSRWCCVTSSTSTRRSPASGP